jgi:hypothetical protein
MEFIAWVIGQNTDCDSINFFFIYGGGVCMASRYTEKLVIICISITCVPHVIVRLFGSSIPAGGAEIVRVVAIEGYTAAPTCFFIKGQITCGAAEMHPIRKKSPERYGVAIKPRRAVALRRFALSLVLPSRCL